MKELVPSEFFLSQNYPNPFKDVTKIKYCLPEKTKVNLTVYNSDGEKVKQLVNQIQGAGTYETTLDGYDFKNGFYYYRLEAGSYVENKKMVLLK
jgi:flagellar hook assembly protein FlgD